MVISEDYEALAEQLTQTLIDILEAPWTIHHKNILQTFFADLADVVPVVGEVAGLYRILLALDEGDMVRAITELGDLISGIPPVYGDILDLLSPTNLINHLIGKEQNFIRAFVKTL